MMRGISVNQCAMSYVNIVNGAELSGGETGMTLIE